jgi:formamidopyrimidine-DNA glycosylase
MACGICCSRKLFRSSVTVPELPEVETTCRGLAPHLLGVRIEQIILRRPNLRWPIPQTIQNLQGQRIDAIERRAKYCLMRTQAGSALWHLGMSGSLRVLDRDTPLKAHDHIDWRLSTGAVLRFNDARRFGCLMFEAPSEMHPLLCKLGPEPLSEQFDARLLYQITRHRRTPIKHVLMDQSVVVGVGNIYVAESLFQSGVRPTRHAEALTRADCTRLVRAIKAILNYAIQRGGTTLRDFISPDGQPGYFEQELFVYGRKDLPCKRCTTPVQAAELGTRQSLFCPKCQK